jgi:HNH endonuclease
MTKVSIDNERLLTAERLRRLLGYDPETGVFTRLVRTSNRIRVGNVAGFLSVWGYREIRVDGHSYKAHRLVWLYQTGLWPEGDLDHKNMDKADNRFCNLREATVSQNQANRRVLSNNESGFKGIDWHGGKWRARITVNGKLVSLGHFDTPHIAYATFCLAARKHFGDYARVYEADQLIIPRKVFEERVLRNLLAATQLQFMEAA